MYAVLEVNERDLESKGHDAIIKIDSTIQSLTWMSKSSYVVNKRVNQSTPAPSILSPLAQTNRPVSSSTLNDSQLERNLYYQEGWLAAGNANSIVGCIYTTCLTEQQRELIKNHKESAKNATLNDTNQTGSISNSTNPGSTNGQTNDTTVQSSLNTNLNRTNFNLRGHKSEIKLVKWNEPYQKLASCDANGVIYVWVKYEGRWSIELINDRGNCVSDFAWSHDGRMAAICYQDGFVLVGSVNGQRFWSHLYDLSNSQITTATWTPNDLFIILGLSNGNLMVIDENGSVVSRHFLKNDSISHLEYNSPKFFIDELHTDYNKNTTNDSNQNSDTRLRFSFTNEHRPFVSHNSNSRNKKINNNNYMLASSFKSSGSIYLLRNYEDIDPVVIDTKLQGVVFEWSKCGQFLAVGGHSTSNSCDVNNFVQFYNVHGVLMFSIELPTYNESKLTSHNSIISDLIEKTNKASTATNANEAKKSEVKKQLTALTWGHDDQRVFVACSNTIHVIRVVKQIPTLRQLALLSIKSHVKDAKLLSKYWIPQHFKEQLNYHFASSIRSVYPNIGELRRFVCTPLPTGERLHCTMKCMKNNSFEYYILYLEYLGGLIPLLSARKVSQLKTDFVILDPLAKNSKGKMNESKVSSRKEFLENGAANLNQTTSGYVSSGHSTQTNTLRHSTLDGLVSKSVNSRRFSTLSSHTTSSCSSLVQIETNQDQHTKRTMHSKKKVYLQNSFAVPTRYRRYSKKRKNSVDAKRRRGTKPRTDVLVHIKSNVWGTKFKFFGGNNYLPTNIGQIVYKTSLFHLQPRKMTIVLDDLSKQSGKRRNESTNTARRTVSREKKESKSTRKPVSTSLLDSVNKSKCADLEKRGKEKRRLGDVDSIRSVSLYSLDEPDEDTLSININDNVSTACQLVEKKLNFAQCSELPVLKLANLDAAQSYCEYDVDYGDNQCLIVSTTLNDQSAAVKSVAQASTGYVSSSPRFASEHLPHTSSRHTKYSNDSIMFTRNSNNLLSRLNSEFAFLNYFRNYRNSFTFKNLSNRFARKNIQIEEEMNDEQSLVNNLHIDSSEKRADLLDDADGFVDEENTTAKTTKNRVKVKNKRYVLHNKPPIWNETSQVYQLDFGGRVTQESAKNFQVEYAGKQVMQFGRIDANAYTLDFEWPFTTVQAFSIALANITQRLK